MNKKKFIPLVILLAVLSTVAMIAVQSQSRRGALNSVGTLDAIKPGTGWSGMPENIAPEMGTAEPYGMMNDSTVRRIMPMPTYYPYPGPDDALTVEQRDIEKYASHSVIVSDVGEYMQRTRDYISSIEGVVLSYNQSTDNSYSYGYITAKVPVTKFDEAVRQVTKDVKKVIQESISSQDITGQTVSVDTTLEKLKTELAERQLDLEEATTDVDKRRIQLDIDRIERQIEQQEQVQQNLDNRISYATMSISAANKENYYNPGGPRPLMDVLREAWYSLQTTGFGIAGFLIWVVVYAIIWIPVLLLVRWIWGKVRPTAPKTTSK